MMAFKKKALTLVILLINIAVASAQTDTTFRKTGFTFGALPAIAYDNDLGFEYGVLTNLYWYGDGSTYPRYNHSLYIECSRYVAGTSLLRAYYDTHKLIPGFRTTADLTRFNDIACDFSGFNGAETYYRRSLTDEDSDDYLSTIFYAHKRDMRRAMLNIRSEQFGKWFWQAGFTLFDMRIGKVQKDKLRHEVPDIPTVYDKYVEWNIIGEKEADGGVDTYLRLGGGIDTRDNEAFATQGVWTEVLLAAAPSFLSSDDNNWGRITVYHRQYFNLHNRRTVLAYRLGWQHKIWGDIPFYLLPHWNTGVLGAATSQGIGGGKTMRGVVRNRIVGDGSVMANIELRQIIYSFMLAGQNFSIGTNLFTDMGMVTQLHDVDKSLVPSAEHDLYFTNDKETLHTSAGIGLKIAMNSNFVLSADWGKALNKNDGTSGFYVLMNYLF